jgi:hypothetical protein
MRLLAVVIWRAKTSLSFTSIAILTLELWMNRSDRVNRIYDCEINLSVVGYHVDLCAFIDVCTDFADAPLIPKLRWREAAGKIGTGEGWQFVWHN